jgi:hypothetical protein
MGHIYTSVWGPHYGLAKTLGPLVAMTRAYCTSVLLGVPDTELFSRPQKWPQKWLYCI